MISELICPLRLSSKRNPTAAAALAISGRNSGTNAMLMQRFILSLHHAYVQHDGCANQHSSRPACFGSFDVPAVSMQSKRYTSGMKIRSFRTLRNLKIVQSKQLCPYTVRNILGCQMQFLHRIKRASPCNAILWTAYYLGRLEGRSNPVQDL